MNRLAAAVTEDALGRWHSAFAQVLEIAFEVARATDRLKHGAPTDHEIQFCAAVGVLCKVEDDARGLDPGFARPPLPDAHAELLAAALSFRELFAAGFDPARRESLFAARAHRLFWVACPRALRETVPEKGAGKMEVAEPPSARRREPVAPEGTPRLPLWRRFLRWLLRKRRGTG